jgi:uncharacterized protein (DUF427 family)
MSDTRPRLTPNAEHPITLGLSHTHVVVRVGSTVIAETDRALEMHEASYPPVLYVPLDDVDQSLLSTSDEHTYCPYKGEASYFDLTVGEAGSRTASVWYYEDPYPAVADIAGHVAFYPDRVSIESESTDR